MDGMTRHQFRARRIPGPERDLTAFALGTVAISRSRRMPLAAFAVGLAAVAMSRSALAQAAGAGLGTHLGIAAGAELVNLGTMWATLKFLLAGAAGIGAAYYLWAIGRRNHHSGAHAGMVACAALAAFIAVSWGQTIQAGVQTLWQAAPDITLATAVAPEQW